MVTLEAGVVLDRETTSIPHNDNGDAVFTFGVAAMDRGTPVLISYTTVSFNTLQFILHYLPCIAHRYPY